MSRRVQKTSSETNVIDNTVTNETKVTQEDVQIVETAKGDTVIKQEGDSARSSRLWEEMVKHSEPLVVETEGSKAVAKYDPKTGSLTMEVITKEKSRHVVIDYTRRTNVAKTDSGTRNIQSAVKTNIKQEIKQKDTKTNFTTMIIVGAIMFVVLVCLLIYIKKTRIL
jgi:hypothetical protein